MSCPHDGPRPFFPIGNPFRRNIQKSSYLSKELLQLQNSFEEGLTERLRNLNENVHSDVFSLSWMKDALVFLTETHRAIQSLITDLQFPVSEWDEQWMDMYLDNSVKLLDICNGYSSELARLDQARLLMQYILHIFEQLGGSTQINGHVSCPSHEQLRKKSLTSLCEWKERNNARSPRLGNTSCILQGLAESLRITTVKKSAKGKVLMRAMYGVRVHTIFVCSILSAILSGSTEPMELPVPETFLWSGAFKKLQTDVKYELSRLSTSRKVMQLKEFESVDQCVLRLTSVLNDAGQSERNMQQKVVATAGTGHVGSQESDQKTMFLKEIVLELVRNVKVLTNNLDNLSKEVGDFFGILLAGRDELLCNLRTAATKNGKYIK